MVSAGNLSYALVGVGEIIAAWRRGPAQRHQRTVVQPQTVADVVETDGVRELRVDEAHFFLPIFLTCRTREFYHPPSMNLTTTAASDNTNNNDNPSIRRRIARQMRDMRFSRKLSLLGAAAMASALFCANAQAAFIVNLVEDGLGNVVATGSGTIDTTDLTLGSTINQHATVFPSNGQITLGPTGNTSCTFYSGVTGPTTEFGIGSFTNPSSGSGNLVEINGGTDHLFLPLAYSSGAALSDTDTWNGASLSSLGATPGTYVWTWGTGPDADSFTLNVGTVPEPSAIALCGLAAAGMICRRWRSSRLANP